MLRSPHDLLQSFRSLEPVWVWLASNEIPPTLTLVSGAIVMLAVLGHLWGDRRSSVATATDAR